MNTDIWWGKELEGEKKREEKSNVAQRARQGILYRVRRAQNGQLVEGRGKKKERKTRQPTLIKLAAWKSRERPWSRLLFFSSQRDVT